MNTRMQNRISSYLSGWFQEDWLKTILWHEDKLYVKDIKILDEILFNLGEHINLDAADTSISKDPEFNNWYVLDVKH